MGMVYSLFVGPSPPRKLDLDENLALLEELCSQRIIKFPFAIVENDYDRFFFDHSSDKLLAKGKSKSELLKSSQSLLVDDVDLCIWFDGFDWTNEELVDSFRTNDYFNVDDVMLYFPKNPRVLPIKYEVSDGPGLGEFHVETRDIIMHDYFCSTGQNGPQDIEGTVLKLFLQKHYGNDLVVDCSPEFYA